MKKGLSNRLCQKHYLLKKTWQHQSTTITLWLNKNRFLAKLDEKMNENEVVVWEMNFIIIE